MVLLLLVVYDALEAHTTVAMMKARVLGRRLEHGDRQVQMTQNWCDLSRGCAVDKIDKEPDGSE